MTTKTVNTREEIIRKGSELIHAKGYNATGIQQILQAAGVPKGSFYFYFKSKEDFGLAVIDYFTSTMGGVFVKYLADTTMAPLQRLDGIFAYCETFYEQMGSARGCPFGNLSLEMAGTSERLRLHLNSVIGKLVSGIEACLKEARDNGVLPADIDAADAAQAVFHGLEGAILHMKVAKSMEPFRAFRRYIFAYLLTDKCGKGGVSDYA
ncbi:MAG: TetR/AcrR family transcriptional regulator [Syntrophales bacterium]|nr:TetR/AcrR family transcriptional regulator [Syntrophales bacterium]